MDVIFDKFDKITINRLHSKISKRYNQLYTSTNQDKIKDSSPQLSKKITNRTNNNPKRRIIDIDITA